MILFLRKSNALSKLIFFKCVWTVLKTMRIDTWKVPKTMRLDNAENEYMNNEMNISLTEPECEIEQKIETKFNLPKNGCFSPILYVLLN